MQFFGLGKKKPDAKEVLKEETRNIKRSEREIERERLGLQRQEQKLIADIKKAAKERMGMMKSQIAGAATQMKLNHTQAKMVESMAGAANAMGKMNEAVDPAKMMKMMAEFARENEMMDTKQEMMDEALDGLFDDDVIEGEADAVTEQVLAEIGIDVAGQMAGARPSAGGMKGKVPEAQLEDEDDDLTARLAALKGLG